MQYNVYPQLPDVGGFVATTGFFDGVHRGHLAVLQQVVEMAKKERKPSCVVTFWPHPRIVLQKDVDKLKLLSTLDEKRALIAGAEIDNMIVIPFTPALSHQSAEQFFNTYLLNELNISYLIVGYDHHFGKGGEADFQQIKQLGEKSGITVEQVQANDVEGITVSSSKIREALQSGDIILANQLLGYAYSVTGTVVGGKKLGRQMGFPTANIQPDEPLKLIPQDGIYAVEVVLKDDDTVYKGMLSIGFRPTVNNENIRTIEVNIFDFDRTIYGETTTIRFIKRLRNELKFESIEALRQQLIQDKATTLAVFKN